MITFDSKGDGVEAVVDIIEALLLEEEKVGEEENVREH
jgi:hypothetical protein